MGTLPRNLNKSGKTFDRLGLSQCKIAAQVRGEVDEFKQKVPIITNLRNLVCVRDIG